MIFPLAKDHQKHLLDLDHATSAVYKKEADTFCWGGGLLSLKVAFSGRAGFHLENTAMSPSHFLRTFKLLFHMTPYKYLRQRRMKRAAYMLRDYAISITEVCNSVGFKSLSNFSWEFQKWYGVSPRAYRLKNAEVTQLGK
jgi:hypothetical protein